MSDKKIAIIGGGNLGASIAEGLHKSNEYENQNVTVTRRKIELIKHLSDAGINVHSDNKLAVKSSDVIVLAVKPYNVDKILNEIKHELTSSHILISSVAGISISHMQTIVGAEIPVFRAIPNTAISILESMTCIATQNGKGSHKDEVVKLFDQMGKSIVINEDLMDAATALAACGIAFALRFIRAASQGGIEIGFDAKTAQTIAVQTVRGATGLLTQGGKHPEEEIDKVTTPQGCTIAGINEMEHQGFSSSLIKGIISSYKKL